MKTDWPKTLRWTVDSYDRLTAEGHFDHLRVELVEGRIVRMAPQREPHAVGVLLARDAAAKAFGPGWTVRTQMPLRLGRRSKPEPDIAVVPGGPRDSLLIGAPSTPALVIEISDSTLQYDRRMKAALYAAHGISDYWIVNLIDRQVEVCRDPIADAALIDKFQYATVQILRAGDSVIPLGGLQSSIAIASLLP